jgi:glyoxylase-like metal-dependent hydrolase (beta-lactamase superfamily II)
LDFAGGSNVIITESGPIIEDLYMLGHPAIPIYLLDGDRPAIFDAGFACLGEKYAEDIKGILGRRQPVYCFLTHSHFDHCGAVSVLRENFPAMKVIASPRAREVLKRPNAINLIRNLNHHATRFSEAIGLTCNPSLEFKSFRVDDTLVKGDIIKLADRLTLHVYETPGHTWDCLSYYIPEKKILFTSEAAGQPDLTGYIVSDCLADYDEYLRSIKLLSLLDFDVLCLGHLFAYTGQDARNYIRASLAECERFRQLVEACLIRESWDLERVKNHIKSLEYDSNSGPKQLETAYLLNLEARIKAIRKQMDETHN